jgi:hypothetical protein
MPQKFTPSYPPAYRTEAFERYASDASLRSWPGSSASLDRACATGSSRPTSTAFARMA